MREAQMFGRRRQVKDLKVQLITTRVLFGPMFQRLPPDKQRLVIADSPQSLATSVSRAVAAGEAVTARVLIEAAAREVPAGVTVAQWANIMHPAYAALA